MIIENRGLIMTESKNYIKLKRELDRKNAEFKKMGGNLEANKDLDYTLSHPNMFQSLDEARRARLAEEQEIITGAKIEEERIKEERTLAQQKALEDYCIKCIPENIMITIDGERKKKIKSPNDIKCPHCEAPSYQVLSMAKEAAQGIKSREFTLGPVSPYFKIDSIQCRKCKEYYSAMVQAIF